MNRSIAMTFTLVAGAIMALVGCVSIPDRSAHDDTAMMLNYPWVELSATEAQATLYYPWANLAMDSEATEVVSTVSLYYPWTSFSAEADEPSNDRLTRLYFPSAAFSVEAGASSNDLVYADSQSIGLF